MEVRTPRTVVASRLEESKPPDFAQLVMTLGKEARRLAKPARLLGAFFLCAALLCWFFLFFSYAFDSLKLFALSLVFLALVLAPGLLLLSLGASLRELARLPGRLAHAKVAHRATVESTQEEDSVSQSSRLRKIGTRVDSLLVLWARLRFSKDELEQLAGPSRSLAFMAHPGSVFLVGAALLIGVFVTLGTSFALIAGLASRVF